MWFQWQMKTDDLPVKKDGITARFLSHLLDLNQCLALVSNPIQSVA